MLAKAICTSTSMDPNKKVGSLTEQEIKILENAIQNPSIPNWMLNRRKDYETGGNLHLTGTDLQIAQREDIKREKRIKSYRGIRHAAGLPVRGQRTRTSFRKGATVGVSRKKNIKKEKKK